MTRSRMFRRSTTRDILYFQDRTDADDLQWMVDLAAGTRESVSRTATKNGLSVGERHDPHLLFSRLDKLAWADQQGDAETVSPYERRSLTEVRVPDHGDDLRPIMTYCEWTGFTRGNPNDLLLAFGKADAKQDDT